MIRSIKFLPLNLFFIVIIFLIISMVPVSVTSDTVSDQLPIIVNGESPLPVYDTAQNQILDNIREESHAGQKLYVSRPFGYLECTGDSNVNLSIIKTYIDWVSGDEAFIKGEIKNLDDRTIDLIIITFNLYNADGHQIGNAYASINYLEPKNTWKFTTEPINTPGFKFERFGSIFTGVYT